MALFEGLGGIYDHYMVVGQNETRDRRLLVNASIYPIFVQPYFMWQVFLLSLGADKPDGTFAWPGETRRTAQFGGCMRQT